jgi:hypothetical protein
MSFNVLSKVVEMALRLGQSTERNTWLSLLGGPIAYQGFVEISMCEIQHKTKIHS